MTSLGKLKINAIQQVESQWNENRPIEMLLAKEMDCMHRFHGAIQDGRRDLPYKEWFRLGRTSTSDLMNWDFSECLEFLPRARDTKMSQNNQDNIKFFSTDKAARATKPLGLDTRAYSAHSRVRNINLGFLRSLH